MRTPRILIFIRISSEAIHDCAIGAKLFMVHFGPFWSLLVPFGPFWSLLVPFGPFWSLLVPFGPFLVPFGPYGPFWSLFGLFWSLLVVRKDKWPNKDFCLVLSCLVG